VSSALDIISWLNATRDRAINDLETLYVAARTGDAHGYHVNMSTQEYRYEPYHGMLGKQLNAEALAMFSHDIENSIYRTYERVKEMKVALIMNEWISETPFIDIETKYNTFSGSIQRLAEGISWIVDAITGIAAVMNVGETRVHQFENLSRRLLVGIEQNGLSLAVLRIKGLNRHQIAKLVKAGIADVETLRVKSFEELTGIIPLTLAKRIVKRFAAAPNPGIKKISQDAPSAVLPERPPVEVVSTVKKQSANKGKSFFKCSDTILFDGRAEKRRTYIRINGNLVSIPNRDFEILLQLAVQLKKDGKEWVHGDKIARDSAWQCVSRARKSVQTKLNDENAEIIENDNGGSYRLSVPPENVSFDTDTIQDHWNKSISSLVGQLEKAAI
jgi:hypothetical protein